MLGKVGRAAALAEVLRQIDDLIRTALKRDPIVLRKAAQIHAAAPRDDHTICIERLLEAIAHDRLRHQRGNLNSQVGDTPRSIRQTQRNNGVRQPRLGQSPGQEE